jgi:hypothetical protein
MNWRGYGKNLTWSGLFCSALPCTGIVLRTIRTPQSLCEPAWRWQYSLIGDEWGQCEVNTCSCLHVLEALNVTGITKRWTAVHSVRRTGQTAGRGWRHRLSCDRARCTRPSCRARRPAGTLRTTVTWNGNCSYGQPTPNLFPRRVSTFGELE